MKNIKNISFLALSIVAALFASCQNEENSIQKATSEEQANLLRNYSKYLSTEKQNGTILIQSNASRNGVKTYFASEKNTYAENEKRGGRKTIEIVGEKNSKLTNRGTSTDFSDYYGQTVRYVVRDQASKETSPTVETYIPQEINVSFKSGDGSNFDYSNLRVGTVLSWNVDPNNENGVAVVFEYNPINQINVGLAYKNPVFKNARYVLPDKNGSYTITAKDLEIFPKDAIITCNVLRGNFAVKVQGEQPTLLAITNMSNDLVVKR